MFFITVKQLVNDSFFRVFDKDKDGFLIVEEMKQYLTTLGVGLSAREVEQMFKLDIKEQVVDCEGISNYPIWNIYVNSIQFKASASSSFEKIVFTSQFFVNFVNNPAVTKRSRHYIQNCMTYQHKLNKVVINHQIFWVLLNHLLPNFSA